RRRLPAALAQAAFAHGRDRLGLALQRAERGQQPGAAALVMAGAENLDLEFRRGRGADQDLQRIAGLHRLVRAVPFDRRRAKAGHALVELDARELPIGRTGLAVLFLDAVAFRRPLTLGWCRR